MVEGLTDRQQQLLGMIEQSIRRNERPPSIPELMAELGVSSPNGIAKHLHALESKGYIVREKGARGIRLIGGMPEADNHHEYSVDPDLAYVPIVGDIAAGSPILAQENIEETIPVPQSMTEPSGETFFLRVKGDSMIEEGIMPGDLVMIGKCDSVGNGELAAVMVEDEATVKRFYKNGSHITLMPANPNYEPIEIDAADTPCAIVGRVIGLMRSYRRRL